MKRLLLAALMLLPARALGGDFSARARGTTTGSFLKLAPGARAAAMGEALTAASDDASDRKSVV